MPDVRAHGVLAHRQFFARMRMKIFAQPHKLIQVGHAAQFQVFRSLTKPMSQHLLAFGVIIADGQMLFEVLLGIFQAALLFYGQHFKRSELRPDRYSFLVKAIRFEHLDLRAFLSCQCWLMNCVALDSHCSSCRNSASFTAAKYLSLFGFGRPSGFSRPALISSVMWSGSKPR